MILSDTLFLKEIDVKLSPVVSYTMVQNKKIRNQAQLIMGENMALRDIKANCSIEINQVMPSVNRIEFTGGYKPSQIES